jgi:hypothetical protein
MTKASGRLLRTERELPRTATLHFSSGAPMWMEPTKSWRGAERWRWKANGHAIREEEVRHRRSGRLQLVLPGAGPYLRLGSNELFFRELRVRR